MQPSWPMPNRFLAPELAPGDIVEMDTAGPQDNGVREAIEKVGARAPVPAAITRPTSIRSRWLSPSSRHCSGRPPPEPSDELWSVVADRLSAFTPQECRHYFELAGYDPD